MTRIWLSGTSVHEVFLYDTASGAHRSFPASGYTGATAGDLHRLSRTAVANYVDEKGQFVWLQIGSTQYPLDERTEATISHRLGGLITKLTVASTGLPTATLSQPLRARGIASLAALIRSPRVREALRAAKDPAGGPGIEWTRRGGPRPEPRLP